MSHDLLDSAARAYFEATRTSTRNGELLRQRVFRTLRVRQRRLKVIWVWWVPATALVVSSVAAAAAGSPLFTQVAQLFVSETQDDNVNRAVARHAKAVKAGATRLPPAASAKSVSEYRLREDGGASGNRMNDPLPVDTTEHPSPKPAFEPSAPRPAPRDKLRIATGHTTASQIAERRRQVETTDAKQLEVFDQRHDLALFRNAQNLHTSGRVPAAALRAWESYIAEFPSGALAPEAQFNRALCLIRLGRRGAARDILTAFAQGQWSGYRAQQANDLLRALQR